MRITLIASFIVLTEILCTGAILHERILNFREFKKLAQTHTAKKKLQGSDSKGSLSDLFTFI